MGQYNAVITISAPGAEDSPQTVNVTLNIAPPNIPGGGDDDDDGGGGGGGGGDNDDNDNELPESWADVEGGRFKDVCVGQYNKQAVMSADVQVGRDSVEIKDVEILSVSGGIIGGRYQTRVFDLSLNRKPYWKAVGYLAKLVGEYVGEHKTIGKARVSASKSESYTVEITGEVVKCMEAPDEIKFSHNSQKCQDGPPDEREKVVTVTVYGLEDSEGFVHGIVESGPYKVIPPTRFFQYGNDTLIFTIRCTDPGDGPHDGRIRWEKKTDSDFAKHQDEITLLKCEPHSCRPPGDQPQTKFEEKKEETQKQEELPGSIPTGRPENCRIERYDPVKNTVEVTYPESNYSVRLPVKRIRIPEGATSFRPSKDAVVYRRDKDNPDIYVPVRGEEIKIMDKKDLKDVFILLPTLAIYALRDRRDRRDRDSATPSIYISSPRPPDEPPALVIDPEKRPTYLTGEDMVGVVDDNKIIFPDDVGEFVFDYGTKKRLVDFGNETPEALVKIDPNTGEPTKVIPIMRPKIEIVVPEKIVSRNQQYPVSVTIKEGQRGTYYSLNSQDTIRSISSKGITILQRDSNNIFFEVQESSGTLTAELVATSPGSVSHLRVQYEGMDPSKQDTNQQQYEEFFNSDTWQQFYQNYRNYIQ